MQGPHLIQHCKQHRMKIAPQASSPLPGSVTIAACTALVSLILDPAIRCCSQSTPFNKHVRLPKREFVCGLQALPVFVRIEICPQQGCMDQPECCAENSNTNCHFRSQLAIQHTLHAQAPLNAESAPPCRAHRSKHITHCRQKTCPVELIKDSLIRSRQLINRVMCKSSI